jgi:hypothetical protein
MGDDRKARFRVPDPEVQAGEPPYMAEIRDLAGTAAGSSRQQLIDRLAARYPGRDGLILIGDRPK